MQDQANKIEDLQYYISNIETAERALLQEVKDSKQEIGTLKSKCESLEKSNSEFE